MNAEYYLGSLLFGTHWSLYLLSNYVIESAVVAGAVHLAVRHLKLQPWSVLAVGLTAFFSPAFNFAAATSTSLPFDLLAAAFVLWGMSLLFSENLAGAWLCFTLGVFTKETALFAPFAAALVLWIASPRRLVRAAVFLLPYPAWEALRRWAFHGSQGVYATAGGFSLPRLVRNGLRWPIPFAPPLDVKVAFGFIPLSFSVCLFALLNLCFWMAVAVLLLRWAWRFAKGRGSQSGLAELGFLSPVERGVLLFCAGASAVPVLLPNLEPRFGATLLPLFALSLAVVWERSARAGIRAAAAILLLVPLATNIVLSGIHEPRNLREGRVEWAMSADYVHKIATSTAPTIYLVDDFTGGFSSLDSIQAFAGYHGQLVRIDDVLWAPGCMVQPRIEIGRLASGGASIVSTIDHSCAGHAFNGAAIDLSDRPIAVREIGGAEIVYHETPPSPPHTIWIPGKLSVEIAHAPRGAVLLMPDIASRAYEEQPLEDGMSPR